MKFTHKFYNSANKHIEYITIDWEIGEVTDTHDSGCCNVWVTGEDEQGRSYEADGTTQDGELVDIDENTIEEK